MHFRRNIIDFETGRGGRLKALSVEEAIATSDMAEKAGLVHITPYNGAEMPGVVCNCCSCCCGGLSGAIKVNKMLEINAPSRFRATVDGEACTGCQTCVEICPFGAVEMVKPAGSKKLKAQVNAEKCMGCGVCVIGCPSKALAFEIVRSPDYIPLKVPGPPVGTAAISRKEAAG
jgi:formate hydrogenlyase subunit 6/NADH:ubiquinone oxidoreductase subunit I